MTNATFQFDLVSVEHRFASLKVQKVHIKGSEGNMTVMAGHTAVITQLLPSVIDITPSETNATDAEHTKYLVLGGIAEITPNVVNIFAETIVPVPHIEIEKECINKAIQDAQSAQTQATGAAKDDADKLLYDLKILQSELNV